jgi:MinD-like ATPase involved in chromosome partitioning or flagellar assembly
VARIVTLHSYRGGTGKSSTAANLARLAADQGLRAALVDIDLQSPGAHLPFGIRDLTAQPCLADYLVGRCEIEGTAFPVPAASGALYLIPARRGLKPNSEIMVHGYDVGLLSEGFDRLVEVLDLDVLFLDTPSGIGNETVGAVACCDSLVIMTRADHLVAEAAEALSLASSLAHPRQAVVVNMLPAGMANDAVRQQAESVYGCPVVAVLPYCPEMAILGNQGLAARDFPDHPIVAGFRQVINEFLGWRP